MHSDSFFIKGHGHAVCQDYAEHGVSDGVAYALLSDGCSGVAHSDVISRVLVRCALPEIPRLAGSAPWDPIRTAVVRAETVAGLVGLKNLAATLCGAFVGNGMASFFVCGDGGAIVHFATGECLTFSVKYEAGELEMPAYPADLCRYSESELAGLAARRGASSWRRVLSMAGEGFSTQTSSPAGAAPVLFREWDQSSVVSIAVFSDGIFSLQEERDQHAMLREGGTFKNRVGVFAQRRLARMVSEYEHKGLTFADDLSIAAVST